MLQSPRSTSSEVFVQRSAGDELEEGKESDGGSPLSLSSSGHGEFCVEVVQGVCFSLCLWCSFQSI